MIRKKIILDPCCGGRQMWVDKKNPLVVYGDIRTAAPGHIKEQPNHSVEPDIIIDFRNMPFDDKSFKLVVFDPPHLTITRTGTVSIMVKKFGCLIAETWQSDLKKGFAECWRVLEDFGVLIFKWNDVEISYKKVLAIIGQQPLFQNTLKKNSARNSTYWACFMKIPETAEGKA